MLKIEICVGLSCHLLGAQDLIEAVETLPPEKRRQIDLCEVSCVESCGNGPNARMNGTQFLGLTPGRLLDEIERHFVQAKTN